MQDGPKETLPTGGQAIKSFPAGPIEFKIGGPARSFIVSWYAWGDTEIGMMRIKANSIETALCLAYRFLSNEVYQGSCNSIEEMKADIRKKKGIVNAIELYDTSNN